MMLRTALLLFVFTSACGQAPVRINVGGGAYIDSFNNTWEADDANSYFNTGNVYASCPQTIANTTDEELYCTHRWFNQAPLRYLYEIPLPNGNYYANLHFAEIYFMEASKRIFDVYVEGSKVAEDFDIVDVAGDHAAVVLSKLTTVTNGTVKIELVGHTENPIISAIEILETADTEAPTISPAPTPQPIQVIRINAGGSEFTDSNGNVWMTDSFFGGKGKSFNSYGLPIANTTDDALYQTNRWFEADLNPPFTYEIPLPNGNYYVNLHFAEIYFNEANKRVFDIYVEEMEFVVGFDAVDVAGEHTAVVLSTLTTVVDGSLKIELVGRIENPTISAIEILETTDTVAPTISPAPTPKPIQLIRINAGGSEFTDSNGNVWMADRFFGGKGKSYSSYGLPIANTTDDALYQTNRWFKADLNPPFTYEIPLPNGNYYVNLHFAEIYFNEANKRVFDIYVEEMEIVVGFDAVDVAGKHTAVVLSTLTIVVDGTLKIELVGRIENPTISSAIEILETTDTQAPAISPAPTIAPIATAPAISFAPTIAPAATSAPSATPGAAETLLAIRINVGVRGGSYIDTHNNTWEADDANSYFNTGNDFWACPQTIANTTDEELYCSYRYFNQAPLPYLYEIPLPNGNYYVNLHFAEIFYTEANKRVFDVYVEDMIIAKDFDVVALVGDHTALVLSKLATVKDGVLKIELIGNIENPSINAIEVLETFDTEAPTISPAPTIAPAATSAPSATPGASETLQQEIRINVGVRGGTYIDTYNNTWEADDANSYFNTGNDFWACPQTIANTTDEELYCSYRYFNQAPLPYLYEIPLQNGNYYVNLHFAEIFYTEVNKRVFDVYIEDVLIAKKFDVVAVVGNHTAVVLSKLATVMDGVLKIELIGRIENPIISAIEVLKTIDTEVPTISPAPTLTPTAEPFQVIRVNAGGPELIDSNGNVWMADNYFGGKGTDYTSYEMPIANTVDDALYQACRWFPIGVNPPFMYDIPVPANGTWEIRLFFAELFFTTPGSRVFDVYIESSPVIKKLDVVRAANGTATAYNVSCTVMVTDGSATIELVGFVENPMITAIELTETLAPPSTLAPTVDPGFQDILINCGGVEFVETTGLVRLWQADEYYIGGSTYADGTNDIAGTQNDLLYQTERNGQFAYEIPVPIASYEVTLHFAELFWTEPGQRVFNVNIEGTEFNDVDIVQLGGGVRLKPLTLEAAVIVSDGFASISLTNSIPLQADIPKLSAIEIKKLAPHLAHAVVGGPYKAVDVDNSGFAVVNVDGGGSHTHGQGLVLTQWTWKKGPAVLGQGQTTNLTLPVGNHTIALTVIDDGGNDSTEVTTISVLPFGNAAITSLTPNSGGIAGGETVTINGSGFNYSSAETVVHFGLVTLTGDDITIINQNTITVLSPPIPVGTPVQVSVETPLGESQFASYTYIAGSPIEFTSARISDFDSPTVATFGPDGKLYVGTIAGEVARLTLNDDFTVITNAVITLVAQYRVILGIAFDPLDAGTSFPPVYVSSSFHFHGESASCYGDAINGMVHKVTGANLDEREDIITGLPVSDHDHGLNAIEFGDNGELYIQIGGNTNGGIPGQLTGKQIQKENYYSAATLVAYLADPQFDGTITYDAPDNGSPNGGNGVEVFASGLRNPVGLVLHSNGKLYGTDNGPNLAYGDMKTGCNPGDFIPDVETEDELVLIVQDRYYGHPNPKRAADMSDPRQCVYRNPAEASDADYTAPLMIVPSSMNGIIEYQAGHFEGQLRGNLIMSKYTDGLYRVILTTDGESVIPQSDPPLPLMDLGKSDKGLGITQAPDGTLIEVRLPDNSLYYHKPSETITSELKINSVFPRRGGQAGGFTLSVYGVNFDDNVTVTVGGSNCPVTSTSATKIRCTTPGGTGTVDVIVAGAAGIANFANGFRFVTGQR